MSTSKTCFALILSIFSQLWSKHDQNSKIKSIRKCFRGLAYGLQDSRKSRPSHTLQSDKLACAKYSNCLPAIANIWLIQVNLSHQLSSKQNFGQKENQASVLNLMGWDTNISLPVRLHTAILLVLLTQRNRSTAANPALQITVCKATKKASSIISFSLSSGFSPVPSDPSFPLYVLPWDSDSDFFPALLYSLLFSFYGIWNPSLQTRQDAIPNLHAMCWSVEIQGLSLTGETPVLTLGTQ